MGEPTVISLICDMLVIECVVIRLQSYANSRGLPNQKVKIKLAVLRCMSSIGGLGQPMGYPLLRLPRAECRFGFHPAFLGRDENKSAGTIRATPSRPSNCKLPTPIQVCNPRTILLANLRKPPCLRGKWPLTL